MCLLLIAQGVDERYPLVVAANRDEFHERATEPAHWWPEGILAGRDLKAGGTWLGMTRQGRFSALTNYRDPDDNDPNRASRGQLVVRALQDPEPPEQLLQTLAAEGNRFNGFNLLFGDVNGLYSVSNRAADARALTPGLYGLSNHLLETPWPKVLRGKQRLRDCLESGSPTPEALFEVLADNRPAADPDLPETGLDRAFERMLSPMFIVSPTYGTRSSAVITVRADGEAVFAERRYAPDGIAVGDSIFRFRIER